MPKKSNINYLELTPECKYNHTSEDNGLVTVLVPRFTSKFWSKLLMSRTKNKFVKLNLDELGSATWLQIDGKKNVQAIADTLKEKFGESLIQPEERITKFMSQLYLNKMITFKELKK